ncbi:RagB/SusD family nutrient uptake outer membrane protein [Echinicola jeungdonensis]|uniref:RagB/SusD family nutrient uptake outer membrane protein n=1 Tax=Echinicola jeungdonensis TaxID=709343 RepID=A0ABV5JAG8_9BACT|nr:RagB/SusD family nutrient uptake outer membrane protein [Echinicola jeungdonensis]MDN3669441.1 RagB/SusD family nutrient uptake outer membrane protein [Echinicola jeungdonensis]
MKRIKYIYIVLMGLVVAGFSSCEDKLDQSPISSLGSNAFYQNEEDFITALSGVYNGLNAYPINHFELSEVRSDNIYSPGTAGVRDYNLINNFNRNLEATSIMNDTWNGLYNNIMRANTLLANLSANVVPDGDLRTRIEGEAKFLRALFYFDLVRFFGKVPVFDRPVTPLEALEIGRSEVPAVYDLIISDLEFSISNLPPNYSSATNFGRATSYAARGLLARVYMTRSGPQLHPDGPTLNSNEWGEALEQLNAIIDSNQFDLLDDYGDVFAYDNENNEEIVFDIQFLSGGQGVGGEYVQYHYPEAFGRSNEIPFAGGTFPDAPKTVSPDMMASFGDPDVRDDFSVWVNYFDANGNLVQDRFIKKYLDLDNLGVDRFDFELNFPVIRYSDILLMKAEALSQSGGSQLEIDALVNQVRSRAGYTLPLVLVSYEQIMEERRREFIGEGLRWHDLVRSGMAIDTMLDWIAADDAANKISTDINSDDLIYAVPLNQLDVKEGLYQQNPGY